MATWQCSPLYGLNAPFPSPELMMCSGSDWDRLEAQCHRDLEGSVFPNVNQC